MLNGSARWIVTLAIVAAIAGCATPPPREPTPSPAPPPAASEQIGSGKASYYGSQHHNKLTANGERFDQRALTAAHRSLPFGTRVRVTNQQNGKQVVVRINDRGPFRRGRIIDVSRAAAAQLDMLDRGVVRVRIETLP